MYDRLRICVAAGIIAACSVAAAAAADGLELRMIKIARGNGASICSTAQSALSPDGKMSFDSRTSTLVVVDRPDYLPHIEELVASLDVKVPMVRMAVRVTEVTEEFISAAGIRSAQLIFPRGSFSRVQGLIDSRTGASTRSEMTLTAASGAPAQLQVSREALYGTAAVDGPGAAVTYVRRRQTGDFLDVLPVANYDNTVTIKIMPRRSTVDEQGEISESSVLTQVTLHSGDTLAIGGLTTRTEGQKSARSSRRTMMFLTADILY
ncbi:MAG TPA: secretin N-terminal domain-containing protein [Candidatus Omnitrophota bacterium]|nr:secretin N-terminal domain-containing protein [Candidatus Omnitrophota bacterium]HQQ05524.1 secretin N-terminal domain-containing protein [Candidatus Omnitrophota bacterium]